MTGVQGTGPGREGLDSASRASCHGAQAPHPILICSAPSLPPLLRTPIVHRIAPDVSRSKEVYLLAANYLQSTDWRASPDALRHLVAFYTKAAAHESLAAFYDACGAAEIERGRDYAKALEVGRPQGCVCVGGGVDVGLGASWRRSLPRRCLSGGATTPRHWR